MMVFEAFLEAPHKISILDPS